MSVNASEFIKSNDAAYYPATLSPDMSGILTYDAEGAVAKINGEDVKLLDAAFELSLVQPGSVQSKKELASKVGKLWMKVETDPINNEDFYDELYLMPISVVGYRRSKFTKFDNSTKAASPLCFSLDGLVPSPSMSVTPDCEQCATLERVNGTFRMDAVCPSAIWQNGEKPACQLTMSVAFMTLGKCIPVIMNLHGVGMSAFNKLRRDSKKVKNVARLRNKSIDNYVIRLTTDNAGTYVAPVFSFVEAPEEFGDVSVYKKLAVYFRNSMFTHSSEAAAEETPAVEAVKEEQVKEDVTASEDATFDI